MNAIDILNLRTMYTLDQSPLQRAYSSLVIERVLTYLLEPETHETQHNAGSTIPESPEQLLVQLAY